METQQWRVKIGSWSAIAVGIIGSVLSFVFFGTSGLLYIVLFTVVGIGGALLLSGREKFYYYLLPVVSFLALLLSIANYLQSGLATLTLVFLLLTIVAALKSLQVYRIYS